MSQTQRAVVDAQTYATWSDVPNYDAAGKSIVTKVSTSYWRCRLSCAHTRMVLIPRPTAKCQPPKYLECLVADCNFNDSQGRLTL